MQDGNLYRRKLHQALGCRKWEIEADHRVRKSGVEGFAEVWFHMWQLARPCKSCVRSRSQLMEQVPKDED